jgi:hypothetical protein
MAQAYSIQSSSSISSPLFQYSSSISLISTRKQLLIVFIGSSILMFVVVSTMILCFIDCLNKRTKQTRHEQKPVNLALTPIDDIDLSSSTSLNTGKQISISSPIQTNNVYDTQNYTSLKPVSSFTPVMILGTSNSHSSSSIDSMTRANTAHNRTLTTNAYTYTALSTSDDLLPGEFDDPFNGIMETNGIEFMMTTV